MQKYDPGHVLNKAFPMRELFYPVIDMLVLSGRNKSQLTGSVTVATPFVINRFIHDELRLYTPQGQSDEVYIQVHLQQAIQLVAKRVKVSVQHVTDLWPVIRLSVADSLGLNRVCPE